MTKKIRVLQLGSPNGLYGAERWILALINHLDAEKIESHVASIKDNPALKVPLCAESEKQGFPSYIIESFGRLSLSSLKDLRSIILNKRIDVLHTHGYKTDIVGLLAAMGTACKVISTPHGWTDQPDFKLRCYENLARCAYPFLDAVVPLSDKMFDSLHRLPCIKKKIKLIRNGVDIGEIDKAESIDPEIASWKEEGKVVIGYIGRLIAGKGLDVLFEAVSRYGQPNWHLAIVGEGEQLHELEALAGDLGIEGQVTFTGFRQDRLSLLKGFDVFVLPSRSEGIPRCIMEAMAAGIPVVASDIPGCRYLVDDKTTGMLFKQDQPEQLAQAIKRIISDHTLRDKLCRNGRRLVDSRFSASRMAQEYAELYFEIAEEN